MSRLKLPSEAILNRQAWRAATRLWTQGGWRLVPLSLSKCSWFWLSSDQVFWTQSFSPFQKGLRWGGVFVYWILLSIAIAGWFKCRRANPKLANAVLFYVLLVTVTHLPFPMITRLRIPLIDPLIAVFAGVGLLPLGNVLPPQPCPALSEDDGRGFDV